MKTRALLLSIIAAISFVPAGESIGETAPSAEDRVTSVSLDGPDAEASSGGPRVSDRVPGWMRRRLDRAFALAAQRLRETPDCQPLFAEHGVDGLAALAASRFHPATHEDERDRCRGAAALTTLGGRRTRLCRGFARLSTADAAVIVIHEALHHAGLSEYPSDPEGMTSPEINWLVKKRCAL